MIKKLQLIFGNAVGEFAHGPISTAASLASLIIIIGSAVSFSYVQFIGPQTEIPEKSPATQSSSKSDSSEEILPSVDEPVSSPVQKEECRQSIYISFDFSEFGSVSHFNVYAPPGIKMRDNGNGTAYFTGPCILGEYKVEIASIVESDGKFANTSVKSGFELNNSDHEQCSIRFFPDGNDPKLLCF